MHTETNDMEFKIVTQELDELLHEIRRRIRRLQSGGTIDSLMNIGANTENQIGASFLSLKKLATAYQPNEEIALLLWNSQKREEQIVACFLFPNDLITEKITQLNESCLNTEIAGYLGSIYLYRYPNLPKIVHTWLDSNIPYQQIAILTAMARHLIINKDSSSIPRELFLLAIQRHYGDKYVQLIADRYRFNI